MLCLVCIRNCTDVLAGRTDHKSFGRSVCALPQQLKEKERRMLQQLNAFRDDNSGATAIEYALLASILALALVSALQSVATRLSSEFSEISGALK